MNERVESILLLGIIGDGEKGGYVVLLDWTGALIWIDDRRDYGETRMNALVLMDDKLYAVTFTWRDSVAWIISFRRANNRERKKYDVQKT